VPIVPRQPPPAPAANAADAAELAFEYVPNLAKAAVAASTAVQAPPVPAEVHLTSSDAATTASAEIDEPAAEPSPPARRSPWRFSLAWFKLSKKPSGNPAPAGAPAFDFRFGSYWTGALARLVWILSVCASIYLIFIEVQQLASQDNLWMSIARIVGIAVSLAVLRIALEAVSVLFDIAKTLRELRDEVRNRALQ
jgi:hypothetical protein